MIRASHVSVKIKCASFHELISELLEFLFVVEARLDIITRGADMVNAKDLPKRVLVSIGGAHGKVTSII